MRRFTFFIILMLLANVSFCQWDDELESNSSKKKSSSSTNTVSNTTINSSSNTTVNSSVNNNSYTPTTTTNNSSSTSTGTGYKSNYKGIPELSADAQESLITSFDAALQRRLFAMKSTAEHEESYWDIMVSYYHFLRNSFDKNLYNVISLNDQVWVEPQYITAMFNGSDPAQGVNDYVEVIMKEKKYEAKKKEEKNDYYNYASLSLCWNSWWGWGFGFGYHWGGWYDPWWGPWGPYGPYPWYGPWYNPWYRPWGPYGPHPWYRPGVVVVVPAHPVYYGNTPYRRGNVFSPSPSLRSPANSHTQGNPIGRGYVNTPPSRDNIQTKGSVRQQTQQSGNRSYRNNTNYTNRENSYRTSSPSTSPSFNSGSFGGGGGGFHSIGGGGRRR